MPEPRLHALIPGEGPCSSCGGLDNRGANAAENLAKWPGLSFLLKGRGNQVRPAMPAVGPEASTESASEVQAPAYLEYQI